MIGGKVLEVRRERQPETSREVVRLWCIDYSHTEAGDELAVWVEPAAELPSPGDDLWWQMDKAYWTPADRRFEDRALNKIAYSFDPRNQDNPHA